MEAWFERYLHRHFDALRLPHWSAPPSQDHAGPLVIYCNHPAWWDAAVIIVLSGRLYPNRENRAPFDAAMLARYRVFERIGAFGVDLDSPRGAAQFLPRPGDPDTIRHGPLDHRAGPLRGCPCPAPRSAPGRGPARRDRPDALFVPLALEYAFWDERGAEAFAAFGPGIPGAELAALPRADRLARLEGDLTATLDRLSADVISREPERFRALVAGRKGVGGVYDLWRRLSARLAGRRFDPAHRAATGSPGDERPDPHGAVPPLPVAAALPAILTAVNLFALRRPAPEADPGLVSILIPARNEAGNIAGTVRAALASTAVPVEVIVGDDHSTDGTAEIVRGLGDPRCASSRCRRCPRAGPARTTPAPTSPGSPRAATCCSSTPMSAWSPRPRRRSWRRPGARMRRWSAACPAVHRDARRDAHRADDRLPAHRLPAGAADAPPPRPGFRRGCGQLILFERAAYAAIGGHGAIRGFLHDGVRLPRLLRAAGYRTTSWPGRGSRPAGCIGVFRRPGGVFQERARGHGDARALPVWTCSSAAARSCRRSWCWPACSA